MLDVGISELKDAFYSHGQHSKSKSGASDFLLLFYAVESGVKAFYLKANNLLKISQTGNKLITHDIQCLIKELRLPPSFTNATLNFRIQKDKSSWAFQYAHEAWRYGVKIIPEDERDILAHMDGLYNLVKGRL